MKKSTVVFLAAFLLMNTWAFAKGTDDLIFTPVGGGKFIYCNNPEELVRDDLADDGENPSYLMNNAGLTPDNYRLYVTHFNRVSKVDKNGEKYPGEDIYFDAVFTAAEDCRLEIAKTAFEIPADITEYLNYETIKTEDTWSGLYACADLLGKPIYTLNSHKVFLPRIQQPESVTLKKGERIFLSDYIENYAAVPYPKHVLMAADFTLKSGKIDLDIFAAKNRIKGKEGAEYPDVDFENLGYGVYKRDRTYKGVADSLPEVRAELEYTVDDSMADGTYMPVTVYNQYYPKGTKVISWTGNLNPQDDTYARQLVAENDVLPLYYKDPSKRDYYGSEIDEKDKNDVWIFDTSHSDTTNYDGEVTGYSAEEYVPNYELKTDTDNMGYACSLGNYGVTVGYKLKVTNSGTKDRYFDYSVTTAANIIVEALDEKGEDLQPVISKGQTNEQTEEIMASVLLPAGEITEFTIKMTLPVQNYGGQRQAFKISSDKTEPEFEKNKMVKPVLLEKDFIERYNIEQLISKADERTKWIFDRNLTDFNIVKTDTGFAAYNKTVSSSPYRYGYYWEVTGRLFLLDEGFNVENEIYFGSQPIEMTYADGKLYVKTIANGSFEIDAEGNHKPFDSYILPREAGGSVICAKDGCLQLSVDGKYYNIAFQVSPPPFVELADGNLGKRFYYAADGVLGVSADGVYWSIMPEDMVTADKIFGADIPENAVKVRVNDEILAFDSLPVVESGYTLVPLRFIMEKLGMQVIYRDGKIIAAGENGLIELEADTNTAKVNGEECVLDVPPRILDGRTLVPLRFFGEKLGMKVSWDGDNRLAVIEGKVSGPIGEIELGGDISAKVITENIDTNDSSEPDETDADTGNVNETKGASAE